MKLRILFNWLVPPLNPLERRLLRVLHNHLTQEAQLLLSKQIDNINYVQRHSKNKEVNLYCIKDGKPKYDKELAFPVSQKDIKIASIFFAFRDFSEINRADFWIVRGYIFSIIFSYSPKGMNNDIEIKNVKILINPMLPIKSRPTAIPEARFFTGRLNKWSKKWRITKLKEPLLESERSNILHQLDTQFPDDYLELISQTEGAELNGCIIYGLSEVRDLIMPEENYYILSELIEQGALAIRQGNSDKMIYFFEYEDERPKKMGTSFFNVIDKLHDIEN